MEYKIFVNNSWQENTVVLFDDTGEAIVVDCGCFGRAEEKRLGDFFVQSKLKPVALINTHLHIDHIFGNNFMKEAYGLEAQVAEEDNFYIEHAVEYAAMLGVIGITPPPVTGKFLKEGDRIVFGNSELQVLAVPGHSPGGLCFYSEKDHLLLTGDSLFAGSIGRTDLPGGNTRQLLQGIRNKLFVLPDEVRVIPGHGPMTSIGEERKHNPFFN